MKNFTKTLKTKITKKALAVLLVCGLLTGTVFAQTFSEKLKVSTVLDAGGSAEIGDKLNEAVGDFAIALGYRTKALHDNTTAMGGNTTASGFGSTAMGIMTTAGGMYSTSMGTHTNAAGDYSTAMGGKTKAIGSYSMSVGAFTESLGAASVTMGIGTKAEGLGSMAVGAGTSAKSFASSAIGRFNEELGSPTAVKSLGSPSWIDGSGNQNLWNETDPIFQIGIGISPEARKDAMTVLKNGNVGIGTTTAQEKLDVVGNIKATGTICDSNGCVGSSSEQPESEYFSKNDDGDQVLGLKNHSYKVEITAGEHIFFGAKNKDGEPVRVPINFQDNNVLMETVQMHNDDTGLSIFGKNPILVAKFEANGNFTAEGSICDGDDNCIGDTIKTNQAISGTLCGFYKGKYIDVETKDEIGTSLVPTFTEFSEQEKEEDPDKSEDIPCNSIENIFEDGCPEEWSLRQVFGNKYSCAKD